MRYRFNWNKEKPASYWKYDVIGSLFFAAVAVLVWWLVGIPWWISLFFVWNAFFALLKMLERGSGTRELAVVDEVTVVQAAAVSIKRFRV